MAESGHELPRQPPWAASTAFYDDLAPTYDRLYPDWYAAVREQADALDTALKRVVGKGPHRVLDCAVGIGTQGLGLGLLGHHVVGTDLSAGALRRARAEADRLGLKVPLAVADMRQLPLAGGAFDAVVCVDALAHLSSVREAARALREMARVVRPDGVVLVSIRDYEAARRDRPPGTLPQVNRTGLNETVAFQVWDWHSDGCSYDLTHFVLSSDVHGWAVTTRRTTLRAFQRHELLEAATEAGLVDVEWRTSADSGFFQPAVVGRVPRGARM